MQKRMVALLCGGLWVLFCGVANAQKPPVKHTAYEARALDLLQKMTEAYAVLPAFDQRTEFTSGMIPLPAAENPFAAPPRPENTPKANPIPSETKSDGEKKENGTFTKLNRSLRLRYAAPNQLRLELTEGDPEKGKTTTYLWLCDGKEFYTYIPDKNWYTKEKAPGRLADFRRLSRMNMSCLELLMLMGTNPFGDIKAQVDSVQSDGFETVQGTRTEIIALRSESRFDITEVRLFIGTEDRLLHRLVTETTPISGPPSPGKIGDALDDLLDNDIPQQTIPTDADGLPIPIPSTPTAFRPGPMRSRAAYENVLATPRFDNATFVFSPPNGALLYGPPPTGKKRRQNTIDTLKALQQKYAPK